MAKLSLVGDKSAGSLTPKHLRAATRNWFDQICREYQLESQHIKILQIAAESWDTYEKARDSIAENGMTFVNKKHGDIKPRPEVAIMQNSRIAFLRALRELNLDVQPPDTPRPSSLKYPR
jgi:phage terminase small subunit